jgi:phage baseplate assembly protein W
MPATVFSINNPSINRYNKIVYIDINTLYGISSNTLLLENIPAVVNQLYNLFYTSIGSRHFEPTFGIGLEDLIFDLPITITEYVTQNTIYSAVEEFLPNVNIDLRNTTVTPLDEQEGVRITVSFSIKSLANSNNLVADFFFPS